MLEDTYGHTPFKLAFDEADVYGVGFNEERANRKKVRLGIIGAGGVTLSKHLPAIWRLKSIWEPVDVVAVVKRTERDGKRLSELYGCKWYFDHQTMLDNEDLDGVIVASPDDLHYEHAMSCIERNLPVLIEKPITRSLGQAAELCQKADENKVSIMTVSNKRYSPPYRKAYRLINSGIVNSPALYVGKFNLGYDYVWLLEQGTIHIFDITRFLIGNVSKLYAAGVNKYSRNLLGYPLDNVAITLHFENGAVGNIYTSATALSFKPWERVEIYGNKKWLAIEDQYELILYDEEEGPAKHWRPVIPNTLIFDEEFGGFMGLIENFLQVIRGNEKPIVTGWDGYYAYEINVATHLSIKHQSTIEFPLDPKTSDNEVEEWLKKHENN